MGVADGGEHSVDFSDSCLRLRSWIAERCLLDVVATEMGICPGSWRTSDRRHLLRNHRNIENHLKNERKFCCCCIICNWEKTAKNKRKWREKRHSPFVGAWQLIRDSQSDWALQMRAPEMQAALRGNCLQGKHGREIHAMATFNRRRKIQSW